MVKSAVRQFHFLKEMPYDKAMISFMKGFQDVVNKYYWDCQDLEDASRFLDRMRSSYHEVKDLPAYDWLKKNHDLKLDFMVEGERSEAELQQRRERARQRYGSEKRERSRSRSPPRGDRFRDHFRGTHRGRGGRRTVYVMDQPNRHDTRSGFGRNVGGRTDPETEEDRERRRKEKEEDMARRARDRAERHRLRDEEERRRKEKEVPETVSFSQENSAKGQEVSVVIPEVLLEQKEVERAEEDAEMREPASPDDSEIEFRNRESLDGEVQEDNDKEEEESVRKSVHERLGVVKEKWFVKEGEPFHRGNGRGRGKH